MSVKTHEVARYRNGTKIEIAVDGRPPMRRNEGEVVAVDTLWVTLDEGSARAVWNWTVEGELIESANRMEGARQSISGRDVPRRDVPDWVAVALARVARG